jgi:hypothetical protein
VRVPMIRGVAAEASYERYKSIAELMYPSELPVNSSMYQSGIDFRCPYSNRPLKPLTTLIDLWQGLLVVQRIANSPYQFNWYMSSAVGLQVCLRGRFPHQWMRTFTASSASSVCVTKHVTAANTCHPRPRPHRV